MEIRRFSVFLRACEGDNFRGTGLRYCFFSIPRFCLLLKHCVRPFHSLFIRRMGDHTQKLVYLTLVLFSLPVVTSILLRRKFSDGWDYVSAPLRFILLTVSRSEIRRAGTLGDFICMQLRLVTVAGGKLWCLSLPNQYTAESPPNVPSCINLLVSSYWAINNPKPSIQSPQSIAVHLRACWIQEFIPFNQPSRTLQWET